MLEGKLAIRHGKWKWLRHRYPQMLLRLEDHNSVDEGQWKSLGYRKDDNHNWWVRMLNRYAGLA